MMMTTMDFAQKLASRRSIPVFPSVPIIGRSGHKANLYYRISTIETDIEDEQDHAVTQSLIMAHRLAVEQVEQLEDEMD